MTTEARPLRLWPGVVIVALQLAALHLPGWIAPATPFMFYSWMGALMAGPLLFLVWWLFFSRARWSDRLGALALLIGVHTITVMLSHPSAKFTAISPGAIWLCAIFVGSLFLERRAVTVAAVLVASLGWTLVRTEGVAGSMHFDYAFRFSATAEERFMASGSSAVPAAPATSAGIEKAAWPGFRGASRDSVVAGTSVDPDWSGKAPQEIWRRPVGPGLGSFAFVGDRLCTQEQREEEEVVVCYDAATGEPVWIHAYEARFWEALAGAGPRSTPTFHRGKLYTLGATGVLSALDASTGARTWSRDIAEDTGATIPEWGFSSSPLVVDDLVVVHAAGAPDGRAVVAYDVATGEERWRGAAPAASYSSPHLATIDGVRQIVMITGAGVFGLAVEDGASLWEHEWAASGGGERCVQPALLEDGAILIGTFDDGTRRLVVERDGSGGWSATEAWTSRGLKSYYNDMVVHRGTAYGFDRNILAAIDVTTGERAWKGGRYGNGQMLLLADQDLLLVLSEQGELALVSASTDGFRELGRVPALNGKTWNHPIVVEGVAYLRNGEEAAAYRLAPASDSRGL